MGGLAALPGLEMVSEQLAGWFTVLHAEQARRQAGLAVGGRRDRITTAQTRLQLPTLIRDLSRAEAWLGEALAVAGTLMVIRIVWAFPLSAVIQQRNGTRRPSWPAPAVVSWAGTRGVVPLAAALSIPLTTASGARLPRRDLILALATTVIVVSLVVQGLTLEPLVRRAGIARPHDSRHEQTMARLALAGQPWHGWMSSPPANAPPMT
jgi:NhaP-type Na+/H+ or K+/H+ antiporter